MNKKYLIIFLLSLFFNGKLQNQNVSEITDIAKLALIETWWNNLLCDKSTEWDIQICPKESTYDIDYYVKTLNNRVFDKRDSIVSKLSDTDLVQLAAQLVYSFDFDLNKNQKIDKIELGYKTYGCDISNMRMSGNKKSCIEVGLGRCCINSTVDTCFIAMWVWMPELSQIFHDQIYFNYTDQQWHPVNSKYFFLASIRSNTKAYIRNAIRK